MELVKTERVFISFGGNSDEFRERVHKLCEKVESLNVFTKIIPYTDYDLILDNEFWKKHGDFLTTNRRGYGYWLWKPYIILKTLTFLNDGDFLVYTDCGCDINPCGLPRLNEYFKLLENNKFGLLTFQLNNNCEEIKYSKRKLLEYMNTTKNDMKSQQIMATALILKKTPHVVKHVENWFNIGGSSEYNFINDLRCSNEYLDYLDHRHDQSIHSLLVKSTLQDNDQVEKPIVLPDETDFVLNWETKGISYPIWGKRLTPKNYIR